MERNPPVGRPSYLISKNWWRNYKKYIFYSDVKGHNKPQMHTRDMHPGPIRNDEELCDSDPKFLKGTGTVE